MTYNFTDIASMKEGLLGGAALGSIGGFTLALGLFAMILVYIGFYVYFALAWQSVAKKKKYKRPWLAWIPFANLAMWLQLGKFHWAWIFLSLIPVFGWLAFFVLLVISHWRVYETLNYPGWLSLAKVLWILPGIGLIGNLAYIIIIGLVAWKKR